MGKGTKGVETREGFPGEVTFKMRHGGDEHHSDQGRNESRGPEERTCLAVRRNAIALKEAVVYTGGSDVARGQTGKLGGR